MAAMRPVLLKCEYRTNPLGIDESVPRLSWALESEGRSQVQSAYRVLVAASEEVPELETWRATASTRARASRAASPKSGSSLQRARMEGTPAKLYQVVYWRAGVAHRPSLRPLLRLCWPPRVLGA
jgi:hypothetical protein